MPCMVCGTDPSMDGSALFRLNDKGQKGVWACKTHYDDAKARHFPDDDPSKPASLPTDWNDGRPKGPWTGGFSDT